MYHSKKNVSIDQSRTALLLFPNGIWKDIVQYLYLLYLETLQSTKENLPFFPNIVSVKQTRKKSRKENVPSSKSF